MASLLELLVSRKIITADQARDAAALAEETGAFIGRILVSQGAVEEAFLARFLAAECTERLGRERPVPDPHLARLLPERLMKNYRMVPLGHSPSGVLRLAVCEPLSIGGIDQVKRRLGMPVRLVLVDEATMERLLEEVSRLTAPAVGPSEPPRAPERARPAEPPPTPSRPAKVQKAPAPPAAAPEAPPPPPAPSIPTRSVGRRTEAPAGWRPQMVTGPLPSPLEEAVATLRNLVGERRVFAVVVGPDDARDLVLRKVCTTVWPLNRISYVDLVAHTFPPELRTSGVDAVVLDGIEAVCADEDEEKCFLRAVSAAYAASTPLLLGMRKHPKDSADISKAIKVTLGLAKVVTIGVADLADASIPDPDAVFRQLAKETVAWSEEAFPGASLRSFMEAASRAFERGAKAEAVGKATVSVASRLAHLSGGGRR